MQFYVKPYYNSILRFAGLGPGTCVPAGPRVPSAGHNPIRVTLPPPTAKALLGESPWVQDNGGSLRCNCVLLGID